MRGVQAPLRTDVLTPLRTALALNAPCPDPVQPFSLYIGFLDIELRQNLIELARDGSAAHRLARRANALVLLDDGMSCEAIAKVLLLDDDTIRTWYRLYEEDGIEGLTNFSYERSACQLSGEQQEKLKAWVATSLRGRGSRARPARPVPRR